VTESGREHETWVAGSDAPATPSPRADPDRIDRFLVLERLGAGGMGVVYAAYDPELDRRVAIKLMRPVASGTRKTALDPSARLLREAQAMARLSHPNVIQVWDVGHAGDEVWIAMELVQGGTLAEWLSARTPTWRGVVDVFVKAGRGLAAAHAAGMVHRDFKPENVLVGADGRVRVTDFGIARVSAGGDPALTTAPSAAEPIGELDERLDTATREGRLIGTPAYMAPEQFTTTTVDARADQFSFCVSLYEALFHQRPFAGESIGAIVLQASLGKIREPPSKSRVPGFVRRVVLRGLAARPEDRFEGMDALLRALDRDPQRTRRRVLALCVTAIAGGAVAWAGAQLGTATEDPCAAEAGRIAATWNDDVRRELAAAFSASGLPYADSTFTTVGRGLDAWSEQWSSAWGQACAAGASPGELGELRMACLDDQLRGFRALVDVLAEADDKSVEQAPRAVASLPPASACADDRLLRSRVAPPADPAIALAVEPVRERLARAAAEDEAGRYVQGAELARAGVVEAEALGWPPLRAEALLARGKLESRLGEHAPAQQTLSEAFFSGMAAGHDVVVAEAALQLVQVLGVRMGRFDEALAWGRHAQAAVARIEDEGMRTADVHHVIGTVLRNANRPEEAIERLTQALAIRERVQGPNHFSVAGSHNNIGNALANQGRFDEARRHFDLALTGFERELGPRHPHVAAANNNIGQLLLLADRTQEAGPYVERGLSIWRAALGDDHPNLTYPYNTTAQWQLAVGRVRDAQASFRRAVELARLIDPLHPQLSPAAAGLALCDLRLGELDEALEMARLTLAVEDRLGGPEAAPVAERLEFVGRVLVARNETAQALPLLERALPILEAADRPLQLARLRLTLANALPRGPGHAARARSLVDAARAATSALENPDEDLIAELRAWRPR
jgi:tetratricopeptide (TPR) repeat protein